MGSEAERKHFRHCFQKCASNFRSLWLSIRAMEGFPPVIFFFFLARNTSLQAPRYLLNFSVLVVLRRMFYLDNYLISWENFPLMSSSVAWSRSFFCFQESPVPPCAFWTLLYWGLLLMSLLWFWVPCCSVGGLGDIKHKTSCLFPNASPWKQ